jgi:hypothetical protein
VQRVRRRRRLNEHSEMIELRGVLLPPADDRSGTVVLTGTVGIDSQKVSFELVSTKTPYLPPTAITGTLDVNGVRLVIDRLVTQRVLSVAQATIVSSPTPQTDPTELGQSRRTTRGRRRAGSPRPG